MVLVVKHAHSMCPIKVNLEVSNTKDCCLRSSGPIKSKYAEKYSVGYMYINMHLKIGLLFFQ